VLSVRHAQKGGFPAGRTGPKIRAAWR
jgi:hypothetical protein